MGFQGFVDLYLVLRRILTGYRSLESRISSTCFNRLDLPIYESKAELQEKLKLAVAMAATGFDLE